MAGLSFHKETATNPIEEDGLVFAFEFDEDGLRTHDHAAARWIWRNYSLTDARGRRSIEKNPALPEAIRDELLASGGALHIDFDDGWLHGEITDLRHRHYTDARELGHFRFAFDDNMLISARRQPLQSVDDVRRLAEEKRKQFRSPG